RLTDEYVATNAVAIDGKLLERMTNVILHEELTDKRADKMTLEEYPIMSDSQYERRTTGKLRNARKDGTTVTEVPLSRAMNRGVDGKDYNSPIRKYV
ncbi:MAG: hypothetical protein LC650_03480, partial [Actinobacteria bacterium]|nr:hypothetical protein [Actinomycetota bacterium]